MKLLQEKVDGYEGRISKLTEELSDLEQRHECVHGKYHFLKISFAAGVEKLFEEMPEFLAYYGLIAPAMDRENVDISAFFDWVRSCLAMLDAGAQLHSDLSAAVAACTLAASVCRLFPDDAANPQSISKAQLRHLRDPRYKWPADEEVFPEALSALPKNIAKNFVSSFFSARGANLVRAEGVRLHEQVWSCRGFYDSFCI